MALTRRQREVLDVIRDFIARNGYSPSLEEIGGSLGLSSVATVHKHVSHLVEKGLVRRVWNQNRSIELVGGEAGGRAMDLPLVGTIAAGTPLEAIPTSETITVPADMVSGRGRTFVLRIQGESMTGEHIRDGDYVIIEERQTARDGETVVALVDGSDATLKRFFRDGATVRLQPAHPTMAPIVVPADRVHVQGVVVGLIRKY
ncbi:MAG TPA: transcriptional repressor LexA [Candidatus Polarisedimenticolaceae bacterium]|nr:transcriptional repressor LexA [Candidatus Polarisedimenticolaceae bacterium]